MSPGLGSALNINHVAVSYGAVEALTDVSFQVKPYQIVSLLGRNGAGKTTLVSAISGLQGVSRGCIEVEGVDVAVNPLGARAKLGVALQEIGLYPLVSVTQNLKYFCGLRGLDQEATAATIDGLSRQLRFEDFLERPAGVLSGGEQRRVHAAIALIGDPALVVLDEPTAGADVEMRADILDAVRGVAARGGSVLYTTHYLEEVEQLDSTVAVLDQGRIQAMGSVSELVDQFTVRHAEVVFGEEPEAGNRSWDRLGPRKYGVPMSDSDDIASVVAEVSSVGASVENVSISKPGLEAAFVRITGSRLDNDQGSSS